MPAPPLRILLTGGTGQVGRAFQAQARRHQVVAPSHGDLPLEDAVAARRTVEQVRPDWVVHAGAMTDVDGCERDPAKAMLVNAAGSQALAEAAARCGARMAFVSTDYVFDGAKGHYREGDATAPVNEYGRSKLAGEQRVLAALPTALVARTAVVFGPHKNNFVLWVRRSLRSKATVKAARDQWVTPTCADDVARQVLALVEAGESGVWHTAGAERLSRLDMARRIAAHDGLDPSPIQAVSMDELAWTARRPRDSSLDTAKVARLVQPMGFDAALATLGAAA